MLQQPDIIDVGARIDAGRWTALQKSAVLLAALSIILDGFDSQLIGYAIPSMMAEWELSRGAFSPVVAAGLFGMSIGSAFIGPAADCLGRKRAMIASMLLIGFATIAIAFVTNIMTLAGLRFAAGLGIGAALPAATTLAAEFTPARHRVIAVTAAIVCVPLGGMLAGLVSAWALADFGWRSLFLIGGALPILFSIVLITGLHESPRFLARKLDRSEEMRRLAIRLGWEGAATARFIEQAGAGASRADIRDVMRRRADTIGLWLSFFLCLLAVYSAFSWLPSMLTAEGLSPAQSGWGLTVYNMGGVIGSLLCAQAIVRWGSRLSLGTACLAAAASAFALAWIGVADPLLLTICLGLHGLFVNGVQSTLYAVAAHVYPTEIRATGTAFALSFGRLGAILSAFAGAAVIGANGATAFMAMLGIVMLGVGAALLAIRNHILPQSQEKAAT